MNSNLSFVAFIDILGFGQMVERDCFSAQPGELHLPSLRTALTQAQDGIKNVRITQFSDSIILAAPFSKEEDDFCKFIDTVASLQASLFSSGILVRGGVSHGQHFHDEVLLFSQALIEAYHLESSLARDPRILISSETLSLLYPKINYPKQIICDRDGHYFIDYMELLDEPAVRSTIQRLAPDLKSGNGNVRSKIAWVFEYASFAKKGLEMPVELAMRRVNQ